MDHEGLGHVIENMVRAYRNLHTTVIEVTDSGNALRSPTPEERKQRYMALGLEAANLVSYLRG